jgi:hypothetical protein
MPPPPNLAALLETKIFPGMSAGESKILRAWIASHGNEWDSLDVEARLGAGKLLPPHHDEKFRADWEQRTRARPDLIAKRAPNQAAIVEAKEQATSEAIWQVLGYRDLYVAEFPQHQVQPIVVCEEAHPTAVAVAKGQNVTIYIYDFPPELPAAPGTEAGQVS